MGSVSACKEAEDKAVFLENQHGELLNDIEKLKEEVEATAGNAATFIENFAMIGAQKEQLEKEFAETEKLYAEEQEAKNEMFNKKKLAEMDVAAVKADYDALGGDLFKLEQEKDNRNHQIRVYTDDLAHQEEILAKYAKEKKHMQEINGKHGDEFKNIEDRYDHLWKIKGKLESTYDDLYASYGNEKKKRANLEKDYRKLQGDVKITMETHADLYRNKQELESAIFKKEAEWAFYWTKYEAEQWNSAKVAKYIKELQAKVEELEDEVKHENQAKVKSENAKKKLERDYSDIADRLEEAGGATFAQHELYKKRESELGKIKRDIEESTIQHEAAVAAFRKKHNDAVAEMSDQIDHLTKLKQKIDKDKEVLRKEAEDAKGAMDTLAHDKAASEKVFKSVQVNITELTSKLDESSRCLSDFDCTKKKLSVENADLLRQLEESNAAYSQLYKITQSMSAQLEDVKKLAYDENKERVTLLGKYRNLEHDYDGLREQYNEEGDAKWELSRNLQRATAEAQMYRAKYESEGIARAEELEAARLKISARLEEAEQQIEQLNFKNVSLEKIKVRISSEYDAMYCEFQAAQGAAATADKKQLQFERVIAEWKLKVDDLMRDVDASQLEARNYSAELFKAKNQYDESLTHLDVVRRENKGLSDEIKDLMDQICEGGRNLHDMSLNVKKYEIEKEELQAALEEAETALENEANIHELEISLDHSSKANFDLSKTSKKLHLEIKSMQDKYMEEQNIASEYREQFSVAERRANSLHGELEESRTLLEQSDRGRRQAEADLYDVNEQYQDLFNQHNSLSIAKRKLEGEYQTMTADLNDMLSDAKASEEKAKKAMVDAARLADELRAEQEQSHTLATQKKSLEAQYKDLQMKLEEAEGMAVKAAKRAYSKLENRIHDLEVQFDDEARKHSDAQKSLRKAERRINELAFQGEEDKKNHERMQDLVDKLQLKVKTYKRQIEEAEEIAALNLAKYHKAQGELA